MTAEASNQHHGSGSHQHLKAGEESHQRRNMWRQYQ